MTETQKRLISLNDASTRYGICRSTLYRMAERREITLIKIGRATRIDVRQMNDVLGIAGALDT